MEQTKKQDFTETKLYEDLTLGCMDDFFTRMQKEGRTLTAEQGVTVLMNATLSCLNVIITNTYPDLRDDVVRNEINSILQQAIVENTKAGREEEEENTKRREYVLRSNTNQDNMCSRGS